MNIKEQVAFRENNKELVIRLYNQDKKSESEIAKILKVSQPTVGRWLKNWGIERRTPSEALRKYSVNEHYFDKIDTPEKAYILGFFYADGCNAVSSRCIHFTLAEQDEEILIKIKECLEAEIEIEHLPAKECNGYIGASQVCLKINSVYLNGVLTKLGAPEQKTFKIVFPDWLEKDLIRHFIRGYYDGDGCIYLSHRRFAEVKITGNGIFLQQTGEILEDLGFHNVVRENKKNSKIGDLFIYSTKTTEKFLDWLYEDATIYLERKYKRYYTYFKENKLFDNYK